jgi:hypothetical protein
MCIIKRLHHKHCTDSGNVIICSQMIAHELSTEFPMTFAGALSWSKYSQLVLLWLDITNAEDSYSSNVKRATKQGLMNKNSILSTVTDCLC